MVAAIGLALSQAAFAQTKTDTFFGEDIGPGNNSRLKKYPKSEEAYTKFRDQLHKVDVFNFENLNDLKKYPMKQDGPSTNRFDQHKLSQNAVISLDFGDNETATLKGMTSVISLPDKKITAAGGFPTSGKMFVSLMGTGARDTKAATIEFSEPQSAFGFYVTDIEHNKLEIDLIRDGQNDETIKFPQLFNGKKSAPNGGICFVGVINTDNPFKKLRLTNPGQGGEGFGFDDMMIAKPHHIKPQLPRRFIVETYGIAGQGRNNPIRAFIGVVGGKAQIVTATPEEAWANKKGIKTITREKLTNGHIALKTDVGYLPDLSKTIGQENKYTVLPPKFSRPGDFGFVTLRQVVQPGHTAEFLRHHQMALYNGHKDISASGQTLKEINNVFLQDVTWHFHPAPSKDFTLAEAKGILTGRWKANLDKTETRFNRQSGLHAQLEAGFEARFGNDSVEVYEGGKLARTLRKGKLEVAKGDPNGNGHFTLHLHDSRGDHEEDLQIINQDQIIFKFHNGAEPIVFDRAN